MDLCYSIVACTKGLTNHSLCHRVAAWKEPGDLSPLTFLEKPGICDVPPQVMSQVEPMGRLPFTNQQQQQLPEVQHVQPDSTFSATFCTAAQRVSSLLSLASTLLPNSHHTAKVTQEHLQKNTPSWPSRYTGINKLLGTSLFTCWLKHFQGVLPCMMVKHCSLMIMVI